MRSALAVLLLAQHGRQRALEISLYIATDKQWSLAVRGFWLDVAEIVVQAPSSAALYRT